MAPQPTWSELLARWQAARKEGRTLSVDELCRDCPQLRDELARRIAALERLDDLPDGPPTLADTRPSPDAPTLGTPEAAAAPSASSPPGYQIIELLGRGGMAVVYQARQLRLNRLVALKMIVGGDHAGPEERLRLLVEAEAIAAVKHPGVIEIYEFGSHDGLPFLALEYCPGGSLADRIAGTALPPAEACRLVEQIARAVQAAHDKGILHRDLKPGNILFDAVGAPRVTDFGLARRVEVGPGLTRTGAVLGTPAYMAPEQARGDADLKPPADVYALGAVLYECLTGKPPFYSHTAVDTILRVLHEEPASPRTLQPGLPRDLETICLKCLHKDPQRRYASASALADELVRFLDGEPIHARPVGAAERAARWVWRRRVLTAAAVVVVTAAGLLLWQVARARDAHLKLHQGQRQRLADQIDAVGAAAPDAVPRLLAGLPRDADVLALLRERFAAAEEDRTRGRLALALVATGADEALREAAAWMLQADDPAEVLLLRDQLGRHTAALRGWLWARVDDASTPADGRYRALVALAALDPGDPRWAREAARAADGLVKADTRHTAAWARAFRPLAGRLLAPLSEAFRGRRPQRERHAAALVLADYAADRPEMLADLLLDADPPQYAVLLPVLLRHRDRAEALLRAALAVPSRWNDAPPDPTWKAVGVYAFAEVTAAGGLIHDRFALCQALPLARLRPLTEALRPAGYRPVRVRPWHDGAATCVAVVWTRDGRPWRLETDLSTAQVGQRDQAHRRGGLLPQDVACYRTPQGDRHVVLWRAGAKGERAAVYAGATAAERDRLTQQFRLDRQRPSVGQALAGADGVARYCGVWTAVGDKPPVRYETWSRDERWHGELASVGDRQLLDVDVQPSGPALPPQATWPENLARAERDLAARSDNLQALLRRGMALRNVGRPAEALAVLDEYIARQRPVLPTSYAYRALLHAQHGRAALARRDVEALRQRGGDAAIEALVAVYLGAEDEGLGGLEAALRAAPRDLNLVYNAACSYAQASAVARSRRVAWAASLTAAPLALGPLAPRPADRSEQYAGRSLALLRRALTNGFRNLDLLQTDLDLEPVRDLPEYRRLLLEFGLLRRYSAVWSEDDRGEGTGLQGLSAEAHLAKVGELSKAGWRPAALSLTRVAGETGPVAASAWHRPVLPAAEQTRAARRRATAALTLLRHGQSDAAWPLWRHDPDPTARSYLIQRAAPLGVDPRMLVRRLGQESDRSALRALVLALGEYTAAELPADVRDPLVKQLLVWYSNDADPGLHGAIDWLLRHAREGPAARPLDWGQGAALAAIDRARARQPPRLAVDGTGWLVNGQGETLIVVPGPVEFRMGSPRWEPERFNSERPHVRAIGRTFAIATRPVTLSQWERFLKDRPDVRLHSTKPRSPDPDGPATAVTFYEAMAYCNWLSEQEGIPKEQWCYPEPIRERMVPYPDYMRRTGYRLPSEAEWEYAARAGAATSHPFGAAADLLPRYSWHAANSEDRPWPVGQKRPNDLGLFDTNGNVLQWCQDRFLTYPTGWGADREDGGRILDNARRVLRGAAYSTRGVHTRSAARYSTFPSTRDSIRGFRVARTLP